MRSQNSLDYKRRINKKTNFFRVRVTKSLKKNQYLKPSSRFMINFNQVSTFFFASRIKNRCIFSGRASSVLRPFRASRMEFREKANFGFFSGISQSSW